MRLISVQSLAAGDELAQDVVLPGRDMPLLRSGVRLTEGFKRALRENGITAVWIEDGLGEGIEPITPLTEHTRQRATQAVDVALAEAKEAMERGGGGVSEDAVAELSAMATTITQEVLSLPNAALHLADLMGADDYLTQHVVDVTALGIVIARELFRTNGWIDFAGNRRHDNLMGRLSKIGLGLLLHDIGKLSIPAAVLDKPGPLDDAEWAVMRRHPLVGMDMLGDGASFLVRAVVRHHHERWDGTGYPDGLSGETIHQFARIASVADVYDAVTSERCYKRAAPPHVGMRVIQQGAGTAFDPEVVEVFNRVVVPFPPGYEVQLADGRLGVVAAVDPEDPFHPTVRVRRPGGAVEEIERALVADLPGATTGSGTVRARARAVPVPDVA